MECNTELEDFHVLEERGIALLARAIPHPPIPDLCPELFKLSAGDSVQVSGSTGCSMLLYDLLSRTLLPMRWCGVAVGGCGAEALFIDTDQRFSVLQLAAIMEASLKRKIAAALKKSRGQSSKTHLQSYEQNSPNNTDSLLKPNGPTSEIMSKANCIETKKDKGEFDDSNFKSFQCLSKEESELRMKTVISDCLKRLVYLKCQSSVQFLTTLLTVDQILADHPLVVLIFLDCFPSYYWADRMYSTDSWQGISKRYNVVMSSFLTHLRKNGVALIYVHSEFSHNNQKVQRNSTANRGAKACLYCGEKSNVCSFVCKHCSPSIKIHISIPKVSNADNISDGRRRRHTYEVQVNTDKGASCLQATVHQHGIKWLT